MSTAKPWMIELSHGFGPDSRDVWCPLRKADAMTRVLNGVHFCQYCGATNHEELPPASHISETPRSVQ